MENKNTQTTNKSGLGFSSVLALIFIVLKLTGKITWSWVWVLSPLWISLVIGLLIVVVCLICAKIIADKETK